MDFPDKIYAYFSFPNISVHLRSRMWCIDPVGLGENIEYIRKDALLEWAEEKKEKVNADDGDFSFGYASAMIGLIDKIESM